jgi:NADPH:quinone reductase-like Zn-dependent oxidoreductase
VKAARIHAFGGPEVLQIDEIDVPSPKTGEVLVRVSAAGVNPVDYKIRQGGYPKIAGKDLPVTLGRDVCGIVGEAGDAGSPRAVMALLDWTLGGYAEYVALPRALCVPKPSNLTLVEAGAVPLAALTAWQGLFQVGALAAGQRVLIHAGSGGVGHFAVQFAAQCGAQVLSTASDANVEFVRKLGAATVIDYQKQRFETVAADVDVVLDLVGGETRDRSWQVLRKGGILVSTLGQPDEREAAKRGVRAKGYMATPNTAQLAEIGSLIERGKVRPVVTRTFSLDEAAAAQTYLQQEHPRGKTVLSIWNGELT